MTVIALLADKRIIAQASITAVSRTTAGALAVTAAITELKKVEYVLQFNLKTSPDTNYSTEEISLDGNVAGATVYVAAGTTISGEIIGVGF